MAKSELAKSKNANHNKDKYHNLTTEQYKTRNQNSNEKRKLRLEKLKKGKKEHLIQWWMLLSQCTIVEL